MSDFRKLFLALAVVLLCTAVASAQPITCNTTANPLTVRAEGLSELVGDVVMSCVGGTPVPAGGTVQTVNISVTLTSNITSRLTADPITEALLFVDDPVPAAQRPCAPAQGLTVCSSIQGNMISDGAGGSLAQVTSQLNQLVNVFQGVRQADNTIVFLGVPINPPGSTPNRVFRIKNLRTAVSGSSAPNGQIFAFLSIQNPPANLQLNSASGVVGFVQQGLQFALRSASNGGLDTTAPQLLQCVNFNSDLVGSAAAKYNSGNERAGQLRYTEGYAVSFKTVGSVDQNLPQQNYNTESGFTNSLFPTINGLNTAGRATHGTRLLARFTAVPANVRVYVSAAPIGSGTRVTGSQNSLGGATTGLATAYSVVANAQGANIGGFGTGAFTPLAPLSAAADAAELNGAGLTLPGVPAGLVSGLVEVPITNGAGTMTWEVLASDPSAVDALSFAWTVAFRAANNPGTGALSINGSLAPLSTDNKMSASSPIPRFADTTTATAANPIVTCVTNLLFPYVVNQAGFDTGIAISNTSADIFGTAQQSGNCTLNYFGSSSGGGAAPAAQTTTSPVAAGQQLAFSLSSGGTNGIAATPGFLGYMIVQCAFRYAHGFAFVSDLGSQKFAHGYLALVMDGSAGTRTKQLSESLTQ